MAKLNGIELSLEYLKWRAVQNQLEIEINLHS